MRAKFALKIADHIGTPEGKKRYNEEHFGEAASRYDLATRAMSLGRDGAWKRQLIRALPAMEVPLCLDLACGTGDLSFLLAERYPRGRILGLDLTEAMLAQARRRNRQGNVSFFQGDMCATGLEAGSVDILTGGYAIRNAPELGAALAEIHRLLRPGGVAALLDFSKPAAPLAQRLQYHLLKRWCGLWGLLLHGNPEVHAYIAASLQAFPERDALHALVRRQGFALLESRRFYLGIMELLLLRKPA